MKVADKAKMQREEREELKKRRGNYKDGYKKKEKENKRKQKKKERQKVRIKNNKGGRMKEKGGIM